LAILITALLIVLIEAGTIGIALSAVKHDGYIIISILYASFMLFLFLILYVLMPIEKWRYIAALFLVADCAVIFIVPEFSGAYPGRIDDPAINYLRSHLGLQRFYTLGPLEPNYSAYFKIESINYNSLPVAANWTKYLGANIFPQLPKASGVIFWAPWYGGNYGVDNFVQFLKNYELLGVRYLITNKGQSFLPTISFPTASSGNKPLVLGG